MNWFRKLFYPIIGKDVEVWHYECKDGHKWEDYSSPRGTYVYGVAGQTRCPQCGTPICKGEVWINGKITSMGAMHCDFIFNRKSSERSASEERKRDREYAKRRKKK